MGGMVRRWQPPGALARSPCVKRNGNPASPGVRIQLATLDDVDAIRELIPRSVRALSPGYYEQAQIESAIRHVFGPDTQLVADRTYFVAREAHALVGCGGWSRRRTLYGGDQTKSGHDPLLDPRSEPARIRAFFVDPAWARNGVGTALMRACLAAARDAGFTHLELMATLPGVPLYRRFGFTAVQEVNPTLPDGVVFPMVRMIGP